MKKGKFSTYKFFAFLIVLVLLVTPFQTASANVWNDMKAADNALANKNYSLAIEKYNKVIPQFINSKDYTNAALMYGRLGSAYAHSAKYDDAAKSWRAEADYWAKVPNSDQEVIAANRKADFVQSDIRLFTEMDGQAASTRYYHGGKYEPILGAYIGAYAEMDDAVHDPFDPSKFYIEDFPEMTGKKHAAYLLYFTYGEDYFSTYQSHINKAKENGVALQFALQPLNGLQEVKDNEYLRKLAREAAQLDIPIFLRFANEMNDPSNKYWYTKDPSLYIEKFRIVSKVFKEEAPNVAIVWAPNDFPPNTIPDYYPGDAYVDWVGVSTYKNYHPELDPLNLGVDRESYVKKFETIYNLYAHKKPFFISEGAVSYKDYKTGRDVTSWAKKQLDEFYTYLPMLYPNVKAYFYFDSSNLGTFTLSTNQTILTSYQNSIRNPFYLSNIGDTSPIFYANVAEYGIAPRKQTLHSFVKTAEPNMTSVTYKVNGKVIGQATKAPWTISHNFVQNAGKSINITIDSYSNGKLIATKTIPVKVGDVNVKLNQDFVDFDAQPLAVNNRTFIPIRQLAEANNATVTWNGSNNSFSIDKDGKNVTLTLNSKIASVNGKQVSLEAAPFSKNGRSYLPLRFISETLFDLNVKWDAQTQTAILSNK
ncbi:stalk domain-containing protein [Ureibacillus acetophenoni]|uniref:Glycosyl hydrolase family 26 n=1 Tax=Ureibacillus acetophenoni TaxID=614649 RepID=A0A285U9U0_9BACL|nr:stalk domain-containing protein [Ureibacillus acetophenoni]SOC37326.1 glycosyl hydrolase family 26 [Ureibacillus acetophenoni]